MDKREIMVHILCNMDEPIELHTTARTIKRRIDKAGRIADDIIAATPECNLVDTSLDYTTDMYGDEYFGHSDYRGG